VAKLQLEHHASGLLLKMKSEITAIAHEIGHNLGMDRHDDKGSLWGVLLRVLLWRWRFYSILARFSGRYRKIYEDSTSQRRCDREDNYIGQRWGNCKPPRIRIIDRKERWVLMDPDARVYSNKPYIATSTPNES
jgi:hypothetical protein